MKDLAEAVQKSGPQPAQSSVEEEGDEPEPLSRHLTAPTACVPSPRSCLLPPVALAIAAPSPPQQQAPLLRLPAAFRMRSGATGEAEVWSA
ncbi:unnamed protein product [Urochloa humidicola]